MPTILILGAADTGRAPMTAAILARILEQRALLYQVASAGILGHDGDSPTGDAISSMDQMGLDINEHVARSLTDEIAESAALMIAVDSGTARVARARFPNTAERIQVLGELAGRARDIPDPFKMAMAAWLTYATEIDIMLRAALPRILTFLGDPNAQTMAVSESPYARAASTTLPQADASDDTWSKRTPQANAFHSAMPTTRIAALVRMQRLIDILEQMPGVVDWGAARTQLDTDLGDCQATADAADLAPALVGLLRAVLTMTPTIPSAGQLAALRAAVELLAQPVEQGGLATFSAQVGMWSGL